MTTIEATVCPQFVPSNISSFRQKNVAPAAFKPAPEPGRERQKTGDFRANNGMSPKLGFHKKPLQEVAGDSAAINLGRTKIIDW